MRLPLPAPLVLVLTVLPLASGVCAAQSATPLATPTGLAPTAEVLLDVVLDGLVGEDYYDVRLERWRIQPGPAVASGDPLGAPSVLVVDVGTITATIGAATQTLHTGDHRIIAGDQPQVFGNAGATTATFLWVTFAPGGTGADAEWDPLAITFEHAAPTFMVIPSDLARIVVEPSSCPLGPHSRPTRWKDQSSWASRRVGWD